MARVTVEDCVTRVPNRFELVMVAAQRGRNIGAGAPLTLDRDNDKNAVVALREIADANVDLKELENGLIRGLQTVVEADEPEGEEIDLLPSGEEVAEDVEGDIEGEIGEDLVGALVAELGEARGEVQAGEEMNGDALHAEDEAGDVPAGDGTSDDASDVARDDDETGSAADAGPSGAGPSDAGLSDAGPTDAEDEPETF